MQMKFPMNYYHNPIRMIIITNNSRTLLWNMNSYGNYIKYYESWTQTKDKIMVQFSNPTSS